MHSCKVWLTYLGPNKIAAILQTVFWNIFSCMKIAVFRLELQWNWLGIAAEMNVNIIHHKMNNSVSSWSDIPRVFNWIKYANTEIAWNPDESTLSKLIRFKNDLTFDLLNHAYSIRPQKYPPRNLHKYSKYTIYAISLSQKNIFYIFLFVKVNKLNCKPCARNSINFDCEQLLLKQSISYEVENVTPGGTHDSSIIVQILWYIYLGIVGQEKNLIIFSKYLTWFNVFDIKY